MDKISALRVLNLSIAGASLFDIDEAYEERSKELSPEEHKDSEIYNERKEMQEILDLAKQYLYDEYQGKEHTTQKDKDYYTRFIELRHITNIFNGIPKDEKPIELVLNETQVSNNEEESKSDKKATASLEESRQLLIDVIRGSQDIRNMSDDKLRSLEQTINHLLLEPDIDDATLSALTKINLQILKRLNKTMEGSVFNIVETNKPQFEDSQLLEKTQMLLSDIMMGSQDISHLSKDKLKSLKDIINADITDPEIEEETLLVLSKMNLEIFKQLNKTSSSFQIPDIKGFFK